MKIIDLFCGAGGLSLGFEQSGFRVVSAIDNCKSSIETFNENHPEKPGKSIETVLLGVIRLARETGVLSVMLCSLKSYWAFITHIITKVS